MRVVGVIAIAALTVPVTILGVMAVDEFGYWLGTRLGLNAVVTRISAVLFVLLVLSIFLTLKVAELRSKTKSSHRSETTSFLARREHQRI